MLEKFKSILVLMVATVAAYAQATDRILVSVNSIGSEDDPWLVGVTNAADVVAYTNETGKLLIKGHGAMTAFNEKAPWAGDELTDVQFGAQVTNIGANAFAGCPNLKTLMLGGNPPALGAGNDFSSVSIIAREDAFEKFQVSAEWKNLTYGAIVPVCYDYRNIRKLAPFLHEIWYDDYVFDTNRETLSKDAKFACSSVRNGNFIGRNLDFFLNDTPEFVVHMAANPAKGRFASVGVAMHSGMREDGVTNGQYTASYDLVPNRTVDGINEKGVAINQNVVAYDPDVAAGPGQEFHGTNPAGEDLNISFVPRFVLDHATNAAHGVELIKSRNLVGISVSGDLLHYMVSDSNETYVVEIITNTVVARHMKVMTNFCLNWDNGNARAVTDDDDGWQMEDYPEPKDLASNKGSMSAITNAIAQVYARHAEGVERFIRLRDNYDEGRTFDGMVKLLNRVRYSQAATLETQPYWYSDRTSVAVDELLAKAGYPDAANIRMLYALKYTGNIKLDELLDENLMADERKYLADKDRYRKDDTGVWLTVHNTTYDIARRMFRITVQEEYDKAFDIFLEPDDRVKDWIMIPTESYFGEYSMVDGYVMSVTNPPNIEFDLSTEKWKLGFIVKWPSGDDNRTPPEDAEIRLSTPYMELKLTGADILAGETDGELLSLATNSLGYVSNVTWEVYITPEEAYLAHEAGAADLGYVMTAGAEVSALRPGGIADTDFTLVVPLGNLELRDINEYRVYPVHLHDWKFDDSLGALLTATCQSDVEMELECPCADGTWLALGIDNPVGVYFHTGRQVELKLTNVDRFRLVTGALVGEVAYRDSSNVLLPSAPSEIGSYTAEVTIIPMGAEPYVFKRKFVIVGFSSMRLAPAVNVFDRDRVLGVRSAELRGAIAPYVLATGDLASGHWERVSEDRIVIDADTGLIGVRPKTGVVREFYRFKTEGN